MSNEDLIGDLVADMFGIPRDELILVSEAETATEGLLGMLAAGIAPLPPPRGSVGYHNTLRTVSEEEDIARVAHALSCLWRDYGWRGVLDTMVQWVRQIDHHPYTPPTARDMFGAVRIERILDLNPDEGTKLELAAIHAEDIASQDGIPQHQAFSEGLRMSEEAFTVARAWQPFINDAFRSVAHDCADKRAAFAALFKGPDRADHLTLISVGLMLATAAASVRSLPGTGGFQLPRSFVRAPSD